MSRPRFQWDAYDQTAYQLSFLCNTPYKDIIQLVGCHNRSGVTKRFILDNCKVKFASIRVMEDAIEELRQQGLLSASPSYHPGQYGPMDDCYYRVNWEVIKSINNAIKRMP